MTTILMVVSFVVSVGLFYFAGVNGHFIHYLLGMFGGSALVWGILMSANG